MHQLTKEKLSRVIQFIKLATCTQSQMQCFHRGRTIVLQNKTKAFLFSLKEKEQRSAGKSETTSRSVLSQH